MGLTRQRYQVPTTEGALGSQIRTGGFEINNFPRRIARLRLLIKAVATQVSVVGCSHWYRCLFPISIALQGHNHTHGGSAEVRSEQLDPNTPNLHSAEGDSEIRNQNGHENRGPGVRRPSEVAPERTSDGGQSGGLKGESSCFNYTATLTNHY